MSFNGLNFDDFYKDKKQKEEKDGVASSKVLSFDDFYKKKKDTPEPVKTSNPERNPFIRRDILDRQEAISAPKPRDFNLTKADPNSTVGKIQGAIKRNFFNPIKQGLFGDNQERGSADDGILESISNEVKTEGLAGALFPTFFDTKDDRYTEAYDRLVKTSGKTRADELIRKADINFLDAITIDADLTSIEKSAINDIRLSRKVGFIVDAFDLVTTGVGTIAKKLGTTKQFYERLIGRASEETTTTGIRNTLETALPNLKGTTEMDDLVDSVAFANSSDGKQVIQQAQDAFRGTSRTQSEKIVYKDGIPVIQRAQNTAGAIAERDEVRTILRGEGEATRMSNSSAIREDISSGLLPVKTTADDTITVYRLEKVRGGAPVVGERVVTSAEFAEGATSFQAKVSDLVKTSKGDYAYAPKALVIDGRGSTNIFKQASLAGKNAPDVLRTEKKAASAKVVETAKAKRAEELAKKQQIKEIADAKKEPARLKAESDKALKVELDRTRREVIAAKKAKDANVKKLSEQLAQSILDAKKASIDKIAKLNARRKTPARDKAIVTQRAKLQEELRVLRSKTANAKIRETKNLTKETEKIKADTSTRVATQASESKIKKDAADSKVREIDAVENPPKVKKTKEETVKAEPKQVQDKNVVTNTDGSFKELTPVGKGEIRKSALYERVMRKSNEVIDSNALNGASEEYRVAHQEDSIVDALGYIDHVGVDTALDNLTNALRTGTQASPGVLNNAILVALEGRLIEKGAVKNLDKLMRLASQMATLAGKEINILNMLSPDNPLKVLAKTEAAMRTASKSEEQTSRIVKQLQQKLEKGADVKTLAKDAIDKLIC